jgi:acetyl-CoA synthetase
VIDEEGSWYLLGRADDTLKVAGKRIGPSEIEAVLIQYPGILAAAAIGIPDAVKGQSIICFCVRSSNADVAADQLIDHVEAALGGSYRPRAIMFVDELPCTRNGKVMRRLIRSAFLGQATGDTSTLENAGSLLPIRSLGAPFFN